MTNCGGFMSPALKWLSKCGAIIIYDGSSEPSNPVSGLTLHCCSLSWLQRYPYRGMVFTESSMSLSIMPSNKGLITLTVNPLWWSAMSKRLGFMSTLDQERFGSSDELVWYYLHDTRQLQHSANDNWIRTYQRLIFSESQNITNYCSSNYTCIFVFVCLMFVLYSCAVVHIYDV